MTIEEYIKTDLPFYHITRRSEHNGLTLCGHPIKRNNAIAAQMFNEAKARWAASPIFEGASEVAKWLIIYYIQKD